MKALLHRFVAAPLADALRDLADMIEGQPREICLALPGGTVRRFADGFVMITSGNAIRKAVPASRNSRTSKQPDGVRP